MIKEDNNIKLSVVLATFNEEGNIGDCLRSVRDIADEIIIFDESSQDKTREIAQELGAKVFEVPHEDNFHITKQKAIEKAEGEWILQLDADERVTPRLAQEIKTVINLKSDEIKARKFSPKKEKLFKRHQDLIAQRDGSLGEKTGEVVALFIPRVNFFLGKALIHGGVYPDGVIRLFKKGKAYLPGKSVHEQLKIDGEVAWLENDLEHHDSPTFGRYLKRMNRYTSLFASDLAGKKQPKNIVSFVNFVLIKPVFTFLNLYLRHKGILDGLRGFIWAYFSSLHFPLAYFKYVTKKDIKKG